MPWLLATVTDLAFGGWLVDFLVQRGWNQSAVRRTVLIGGTASAWEFWARPTRTVPRRRSSGSPSRSAVLPRQRPWPGRCPRFIARPADVGKVGGIINFAGQISGIAASILTGYLVSALHSYASAFAVAAAYLAVGIAGYLFLLGSIELPPLASERGVTARPARFRSARLRPKHRSPFRPAGRPTLQPGPLSGTLPMGVTVLVHSRKFVLL